MVRINTNIPSLTAQANLANANRDLNFTLRRLSTGLRISRGADDPAGLIASETLRAEIKSIDKAISNTERASNVIATAEAALEEVASLLVDIKGLTVEAANAGALSLDEIRANQLQVDSAVESITRIANSTSFAGRKLLNGSLDYLTSGVSTQVITKLDIHAAQLGEQAYLDVDISGITSAEQGELFMSGGTVGTSTVVLEVASNRGVEIFSFISDYELSNVVDAINATSAVTGVTASTWVSGGTSGIFFRSVDYGTDAFVSVRPLPSGASVETFTDDAATTVTQRDIGADIQVAVNGAATVGVGRDVTINTNTIDISLKLTATFTGNTSFQITGGGFIFQLGPKIDDQQRVNIGLRSIVASRLGSTDNGYLNEIATGGSKSLVAGEQAGAAQIIEESINQVAVLRGRLGSFERNTLDTNANSLRIALENITASESSIRDADFAAETANLTRSQILVSAGTSILALANQTPQSVLGLLQ